MVGGMGEQAGETGDLSLHFAGGGSALRLRGCGAGEVPDIHADAGEFHRLSGADVLRDVESFPCPAGGSTRAERRDFR